MKLYLAHPFNSRIYIREWEKEFEKRTGIELANPFFDNPDRVAKFSETAEFNEKERKRLVKNFYGIVSGDLKYMQSCDGLLAIVDGNRSIGTLMEIVYNRMFSLISGNRPCYIITTSGEEHHPWLKYHATKIFKNFDEFETYIRRLK